jgi:iron complex outermembrane receptor protein
MKLSLLLSSCLIIVGMGGTAQNKPVFNDTSFLQPVEVNAVRATDKMPVAKTNFSKKEIEKQNIGQDLPFILNQTPSVVVNADAGNGIGYTGIRIRGTDASRINITLNGIPYNDAESQGTFLVNIPDIASSAGSMQVQRGVGTSTNGAGAFGGSINVSTNEVNTQKGLELNNTVGSFHSFKNTLLLNSGIFAKHFTIDGRLSNIRSDGYIDRASSHLNSFYTSAAYLNKKNSLRLNIFSGHEKTYQAWYGVDEATLKNNRTYNSAGTEKAGDPYDNETDNYTQTHYQLFYNRKLNDYWKGNIAIFFTKGKGYYEQYKANALLNDYGLPNYTSGSNVITKTDLVRRLWLDNNFYGTIFSLQYQNIKRQIITGGGLNAYKGLHFGEIKWAAISQSIPANYRWYQNTADKKDASVYSKYTEKLSQHWQSFIDLQLRNIHYTIRGFSNNPHLVVQKNYTFFNPKAGFTYTDKNTQVYFSYGRAAKEPNRDDFEANRNEQPKAEKLNDFETGIEKKQLNYSWAVNLFYMSYENQLVLTGKINDVGAYSRTNIPASYRAGAELQAALKINSWLSTSANATFSENRIKNFTEYLDDYDNGGQQKNFYAKSIIAFSPSIIGSASVNIIPLKNAAINLNVKYVGRQYMDNTSQKSRSLNAFYTQDIKFSYTWSSKKINVVNLFFQINNIFGEKYEPNGYTFSYIYSGQQTTENYYFPMASTYWMAGLNIKL